MNQRQLGNFFSNLKMIWAKKKMLWYKFFCKRYIMQKGREKKQVRKPQQQSRPGKERKLKPKPVFDYPGVKGSGKLGGKIALITGGDSGIGRAVAILFAKEGAHIAIAYLNEHK